MNRIFAVIILLGLFSGCLEASSVTYSASTEDIVNPDRGFYAHTEGVASSFVPLSQTTLQDWRNSYNTPWNANYTVKTSIVLRHYVLDSYVGVDTLPQSFLDNIQSDFDTARAAGVRLIVRFSYTITVPTGSCGSWICPPYGDAPKSRVLAHINQLTPYLQNNDDVIFTVQNGFVGIWGEQYYSDYFGSAGDQNGRLTDQNWIDRNNIVTALLNAVPTNRMIQLRYTQAKQKYFNVDAPITDEPMSANEAHNGSAIARLGFHNDCFLTNENDQGTYGDYGSDAIAPQYGSQVTNTLKNYHIQDSKYVVIGGETCGDVDANQVSYDNDCNDNVVGTMDSLNYTFLNSNFDNSVNNDWQDGACMDTIKRRLGYRLQMNTGTYADSVQAGGVLAINMQIENTGFAAPANPRQLYLVLRNTSTNAEYKIALTGSNTDSRFWLSGQSVTINESVQVPLNVVDGNYALFLHIADNSNGGQIENRPEYSIQLANSGTWEASTGYNNLLHTVVVSGSAPSGSIVVDGNLSDWSGISQTVSASSQTATSLKLFNSADTLYVAVTGTGLGSNYDLMLNSDNNTTTGYQDYLTPSGADHMIENGTLYQYTGDGSSWSWQSVSANVENVQTSTSTEISLNLTALGNVSGVMTVAYKDLNGWSVQAQLPNANGYASYTLLVSNSPVNVSIDGDAGDWANIAASTTAAVQQAKELKFYHDATYLYAVVTGNSLGSDYELMINSDNNISTGYQDANFSASGADYMLENGVLYKYTGTGSSWSWSQVSVTVDNVRSSAVNEIRLPRSALIGSASSVAFGFKDFNAWTFQSQLPVNGGYVSYALN